MRPVSVLTFLLLIGCADTGAEGMFILNDTAPPVGTSCMFTGDLTQAFTTQGTIFAPAGTPYVLTPLIESRLTAVLGSESEHTIHLDGADIVLSEVDATGNLKTVASYTSLFAASVPPNDGLTNASFDLIPAATVKAVTADTQFSANVTVFGTEGGGRIDGEPFLFPVTACVETNGSCVVDDHGPCPLTVATPRLGNPCGIFQDLPVDCCENGTELVCPGSM